MTIQSSGILRFSDIVAEFGGTPPCLLSQYYRGGGRVPDIPANINIPTTGEIKISDFYGTTSLPFPTPDFSFTPATGSAPTNVQFTDLSTDSIGFVGGPPVADFLQSTASGTAPLTVDFTSISTSIT